MVRESMGRQGDTETRRNGDAEMRGREDAETLGHGDAGSAHPAPRPRTARSLPSSLPEGEAVAESPLPEGGSQGEGSTQHSAPSTQHPTAPRTQNSEARTHPPLWRRLPGILLPALWTGLALALLAACDYILFRLAMGNQMTISTDLTHLSSRDLSALRSV
ncbi:MAG TPA: hypothetical protein VHS28_03415, partial [Chloroflexota bacterium]|nr:hypothetical protein [Chloroflexota bacterium]